MTDAAERQITRIGTVAMLFCVRHGVLMPESAIAVPQRPLRGPLGTFSSIAARDGVGTTRTCRSSFRGSYPGAAPRARAT